MSKDKLSYYSNLLPTLSDRSQMAAISQLGFSNPPLREYLRNVFSENYGAPGAFMADPTFEAVFGWQSGDKTMADLEGASLSRDLVESMDRKGEYRFGRELYPYTHQLASWDILSQKVPQSLVVASGTGSGKTECFMVPILDQLLRLRQQQGKLIGVRALFLYPLNALINSQRHRLRAWTESFSGDVRFCLYNGNTPERPGPVAEQRLSPSEVLDRKTLRSSPPPILVTNSTMLEYMLVRTLDNPILEQSQGKLEWVVLDEAHTYIGSHAAELALLLRRVLNAFGVKPENVRFVATSATIGDPNGEAGKSLKKFLAEVAGVDHERVHLISGERQVPGLADITGVSNESYSQLIKLDGADETSSKRYAVLSRNAQARNIREQFTQEPVAKLSDVCTSIYGGSGKYTKEQNHQALAWLDLLSGTRNDEGQSFLPLRAHLFHQTLSGIWACANPECSKKKNTSLMHDSWPYGRVILSPRKHCDCGSPVYEIVNCGDCGTVYLIAGERESVLSQIQPQHLLDEFELDDQEQDDVADEDDGFDEVSAQHRVQNSVLIVNRQLSFVGSIDLDMETRKIVEPSQNTLRLNVQENAGEGLCCPVCEAKERPGKWLFRHGRLSAPFLLGNILPTLLEYAPDGKNPLDHPYRGRKLLTFNDSRQGTAKIAAKLQQDAERNRVRGLVYHLALRQAGTVDENSKAELEKQIKVLEGVYATTPNSDLELMISKMVLDLEKFEQLSPIKFMELAQSLSRQDKDIKNMRKNYRRYVPDIFANDSGDFNLAQMFLVREFGRRPKRANSLETMGLVAVHYPKLDSVNVVPQKVIDTTDIDVPAWRDFLKICLDFFVRGGGSLSFPREWRNWLGMRFGFSFLVPYNAEEMAKNQRRWPNVSRGKANSTLVRLLAYTLEVDIQTQRGADVVDIVLRAAWSVLCDKGLLRQEEEGRMLPIDEISFVPISQAFMCPVTRRFLDTTFKGVTPYLPRKASESTALCKKFPIPIYPEPFGGESDDLTRIDKARAWIKSNEEIELLREKGVWPDLNNRVIELAPFFKTAEHSAQQGARTLQGYEKAFQDGDINLLSCSTTMEMGIDIGGISMVAMNNVPPHPSNYLQRAGRAGRRQEARSLAMTLCKSNPHDQSVFSNTRWAFDATLPAPKVSLDSPVIVQRHIHSALLSKFLKDKLKDTDQEQLKLNCAGFFLGEIALSHQFIAWCKALVADHTDDFAEEFSRILRHTVHEHKGLSGVLETASEALKQVADAWCLEWEQLDTEREEIKTAAGEQSPAYLAVSFHMKRLEGEYLLRELATRGFLPAYGFPTHIVPFDNYNLGQFKKDNQRQSKGREDNRYQSREMPNRDLATALREYAPGSQIVMDGVVYRSSGLTLNWHIPANQTDIREVQNIKYAWRCTSCGASGSTHHWKSAHTCAACGEAVKAMHIREYIEPAGFAVDFYDSPTNDIDTQNYIPVEPPWITMDSEWAALINPELGRFRTTTRAHIFHQSRGAAGKGYALCLECGRAEPMTVNDTVPDKLELPHYKLRRGKYDSPPCPGSDDPWKIKKSITLGHETWTDACEIQLKTTGGMWLKNEVAATTLAVALRDALANLIGVQSNELGCDVKQARAADGSSCHSIFIFDRHAAGYSSNVARYLELLFLNARQNLLCPANCDSVCPQCVLDFDQRFAAEKMDRHQALSVLSSQWVNHFKLPEKYAYFGSNSYPEYHSIFQSMWQILGRNTVAEMRLYVGGDTEQWDIGPSPLRQLVYQVAAQGVKVNILIPASLFDSMDESDRYLLSSMVQAPKIQVLAITEIPRCGDGWLLAEAVGETGSDVMSWATASENCLIFDDSWGTVDELLVKASKLITNETRMVSVGSEKLRPIITGTGDLELDVVNEMNGPVLEFGRRFWKHIAGKHKPLLNLLKSEDSIVALNYQDRYLFTPISHKLLLEIAKGLKEWVGKSRWHVKKAEVTTWVCRPKSGNWAQNKLWSDWSDTKTRDLVLRSMFSTIGTHLSVQSVDSKGSAHGRILEIIFDSGKSITIRFDQGVSYWSVSRDSNYQSKYFEFSTAPNVQAEALESVDVNINGGDHATQLFIKVRE